MNENEGISAKSEALVVVEEQIEELVRLKSVLERLESSKEAASDAIAVAKDLAEKNTAVVKAAETMTATIAQLNLEESSSVLKESTDLLSDMKSAQEKEFGKIENHLGVQDDLASKQASRLDDLASALGRITELLRDKTDTLRAELDALRSSQNVAMKGLEEIITAGQDQLVGELKTAQKKTQRAIIITSIVILSGLALAQWFVSVIGG